MRAAGLLFFAIASLVAPSAFAAESSLTVATEARPASPSVAARNAPPSQSAREELGLGVGAFASINGFVVPRLRFTGTGVDPVDVDAALLGGGVGVEAVLTLGSFRPLILRAGGGTFGLLSGEATILTRPAPSMPVELPTPSWFSLQLASEQLFDVGPLDLVLEPRLSVDLLWMQIPSEGGAPREADAVAFEAGAGAGVRFRPGGIFSVTSIYYAGAVLSPDTVGYALASTITLGIDTSLPLTPRSHDGD